MQCWYCACGGKHVAAIVIKLMVSKLDDSNSTAITQEAKQFYENLYASWGKEIVKVDIQNFINIWSLSQEQSNLECHH